eukprot:scaffold3555_cov113-Isochrysis_galbana.AAC.2
MAISPPTLHTKPSHEQWGRHTLSHALAGRCSPCKATTAALTPPLVAPKYKVDQAGSGQPLQPHRVRGPGDSSPDEMPAHSTDVAPLCA